MSILLDILKFLGILFCVLMVFNFIILVHEWGHFLAARWRGLKIEKFQIWMGKPIWKRTWNGVQYGLGSIPLGGFVQLPQMAPMGSIEGKLENNEPLPPIKPLDKIIVAFAGPLFSFLLAVLFACSVWAVGKPRSAPETDTRIGYVMPDMPASKSDLKAGDKILEVDGHVVKGFRRLSDSVMWAIAAGRSDDVIFKVQRAGEATPRTITVHAPYKDSDDYKKWDQETSWLSKLVSRPPMRKVGIAPAAEGQIKEIMKNSPAEEAGLMPGDIIDSINGEKCFNPVFAEDLASKRPDKEMTLIVKRQDQLVTLKMTPRIPEKPEGGKEARIGIALFEPLDSQKETIYERVAPMELIGDCFRNTAATLGAVTSRDSNIGLSQMSGPVGIMNLYYTIFQNPDWWRLVLWFSVVLNVGLAIFNMMPLPVLDGGHITMALLEMIRGKAIGTRLLEYVQLVCVLCLFSFVIFVTFKDFGSIFGGGEKAVPQEFLPRSATPPAP